MGCRGVLGRAGDESIKQRSSGVSPRGRSHSAATAAAMPSPPSPTAQSQGESAAISGGDCTPSTAPGGAAAGAAAAGAASRAPATALPLAATAPLTAISSSDAGRWLTSLSLSPTRESPLLLRRATGGAVPSAPGIPAAAAAAAAAAAPNEPNETGRPMPKTGGIVEPGGGPASACKRGELPKLVFRR